MGAGDNSRLCDVRGQKIQQIVSESVSGLRESQRQTVPFVSFCFIPCLQSVPNFQEIAEFTTL